MKNITKKMNFLNKMSYIDYDINERFMLNSLLISMFILIFQLKMTSGLEIEVNWLHFIFTAIIFIWFIISAYFSADALLNILHFRTKYFKKLKKKEKYMKKIGEDNYYLFRSIIQELQLNYIEATDENIFKLINNKEKEQEEKNSETKKSFMKKHNFDEEVVPTKDM